MARVGVKMRVRIRVRVRVRVRVSIRVKYLWDSPNKITIFTHF